MLLAGAPQAPEGAAVRVECRLPGDTDARVWRLERRPGATPEWWLTLTAPALGARRPSLPLTAADVTEAGSVVAVSSHSANGGASVDLRSGTPGRLDVYVNHGLEVNVWPDLSPDVDRMNTDGARADADCRTLPADGAVP